MRCPTDAELGEFVDRKLPEPRRAALESHLERCSICEDVVTLLAGAFAEPDEPNASGPHVGMTLGRYRLLEWVGAGAMGTVYRAHDPKLDRTVAIKILSARFEDGGTSGRARFLAEARAMATLSHPNVIAVHDVGEVGEFAFFAMELVEGTTLRAWMQEERSVAEILRTFVAAGRGLGCAHERGLVHRDFKPDNVLVGIDGRVRVIDFGLARLCDRAPPLPEDHGESDDEEWVATKTGAILGTPAYMAPELLEGGRAEPRSDQFSFCVALFEALVGARPFEGRTLAELRDRICTTQPRWKGERRVPRSIRAAIERGLSRDPELRFDSMDDLVDRLDRGSRRRWVVAGVTGVFVLASWVGVYEAAQEYGGPGCRDGAEGLVGVWDASVRASVADAVGELSSASWMLAQLDAYAQEWIQRQDQACEATGGWRARPSAMTQAQMACLAKARGKLRATVEVVQETPAAAAKNAARLVAGLDPLQECLAPLPLPSVEATAADPEVTGPLRDRLQRAEALLEADRLQDASDVAQEVVRDAGSASASSIEVQARLQHHEALYRMSSYEAASEVGGEALALALKFKEFARAFDAAAGLVCTDTARGRLDGAAAYVEMAEGLAGAAPRAPDPSRLHVCRGSLASARGDTAEAERWYRESATQSEQTLGSTHPMTGYRWSLVAAQLRRGGKAAEAEAMYRRALSTMEETLGPNHSLAAKARSGLISCLLDLDDVEAAEREARRSLEFLENTSVFSPAEAAVDHMQMSTVYGRMRRHDDALKEVELAVDLIQGHLGPDHRQTLGMKIKLAGRLAGAQRYDESFALFDEVLPALSASLGAEHPRVVQARMNEAAYRHEYGDFESSQPALREFVQRCDGPDPLPALFCGVSARMLARAVLETSGNVKEARRLAERVEPFWSGTTVNEDQRFFLEELWTDLVKAGAEPRAQPLDPE